MQGGTMKPAIVYLAQNTGKDAQYGRDSRTLLEKSLDLLYKNYNARFKNDILIFHKGDFNPKDQEDVARGRREITFHEVQSQIPEFLPKAEVPEVWDDGYGNRYTMGYRHMLRFHAVRLIPILAELGYDWLLKMDDDSFIHSPIEYNLFEFMEEHGYECGYRVDVRDSGAVARGFGEAVLAYLKAEELPPGCFGERLRPAPLSVQAKNLVKAVLMTVFPHKRYVLYPSFEYDNWCYYNNFLITPVSFWQRKDVQAFMNHFDRLGGWYKYRWTDLIAQSAAVQVFMAKGKVHKFTDWTYEHATIIDGEVRCGGIYEGTNDSHSEVVRQFRRAYQRAEHFPDASY
jgi:alpha 1,2-mannosyltransferase